MNQWITSFLVSLILGSTAAIAPQDVGKPQVLVDQVAITTSVAPAPQGETALVPLGEIAEALNLTWDKQGEQITVTGWGVTAVARTGSAAATINKIEWALEAPPRLEGTTVMVPLSFFRQAFGVDVSWDAKTQKAELSTKRKVEMLAYYVSGSYPHRHDVDFFDSVAMAWCHVDSSGTFRCPETSGVHEWPVSGAEKRLAELKEAGKPRYLNVYAVEPNCAPPEKKFGASDSWLAKLLNEQYRRGRLVDQVSARISEKGFDGVILDFEEMGCYQPADERLAQEGYTAFVQALTARLRPQGLKVGIALHPPEGYEGYDHNALAKQADFFVLMAHDFAKLAWDDPEPLGRVEKAIRDMRQLGVPAEKILLHTILYYETPETLREKAVLAKRYDLRGISVWYLGNLAAKHLIGLNDVVHPLNGETLNR